MSAAALQPQHFRAAHVARLQQTLVDLELVFGDGEDALKRLGFFVERGATAGVEVGLAAHVFAKFLDFGIKPELATKELGLQAGDSGRSAATLAALSSTAEEARSSSVTSSCSLLTLSPS